MTTVSGPRFDESLSSVAQGLHVAPIAAGALGAAALLFLWFERQGRTRWAEIPASTWSTAGLPYRANVVVAEHLRRAPALIRVASFASLWLGLLFVPLIVLALARYPFDGISIPLMPGIALVTLNAVCGRMLLTRSPNASSAARSGAVGSLLANAGLLIIAAAHFVVVELQRRDGIEHACSSSVTFVVIVFSVASLAQGVLTSTALTRYAAALDHPDRGGRVAPPSRATDRPSALAKPGANDRISGHLEDGS
jgi:hypothetical protein